MNERFNVTLEAVPGYGSPAEVRLRKFLKSALRAYGLKTVTMTSGSSSGNKSKKVDTGRLTDGEVQKTEPGIASG